MWRIYLPFGCVLLFVCLALALAVCVRWAEICGRKYVGGNMWAEICGRKCGRDRGRYSRLMCVHDWCLRLLVYSFLVLTFAFSLTVCRVLVSGVRVFVT